MKIFPVMSFLLLFAFTGNSFSSEQQTIHIITHNKTKVVTDPSKGFNAYKSWGLFPEEVVKYRKVILYITYQCPDSQRCGEWDYIDNIFLRRKGSAADSSLDIELARMISPYGSRFTQDWKFKWKTDITDFSFLLHDSVEIEFNHTGYESNTDRGWLITLDFEITTGEPVMETVGFQKLWNGSFPYGNDSDRIENYLTPIKFGNDNADIVRLRILQTGHGMDELENCAEFCSKYRKIFLDDSLIEQKQIWRECADNPLYPQAGTWIFDRAGWCPGAVVSPDVYDFEITENKEHTINLQMEPYINSVKPSANYVFSSYLFFYKKPLLKNDLSIEEIISPSDEQMYLRNNPACMQGKVVIKNNGSEPAAGKISICYSYNNLPFEDCVYYEDFLQPDEKKVLNIEPLFLPVELYGKNKFTVKVNMPEYKDEYPDDNVKTTEIEIPPVWDPSFKILFRTNNDSASTTYSLKDESGIEIIGNNIFGRSLPLNSNRLYETTFNNLSPGCYELTVKDTANDGLDFWYNPEGGYGYIRVVDMNGKLIKAFNSDFGKEIKQQFNVTGKRGIRDTASLIMNIFPIRNPGKFSVDIFLNEKQNASLEITTEDKKKIVYKKKLRKFKEGMRDIDISKEPDGFYYVNLVTNSGTITKRMKLKKD